MTMRHVRSNLTHVCDLDRQKEYRFCLVHDTTYVTRSDTLIQKDTLQVKDSIVVTTPPHKGGGWERVCTWVDYLAYCSLLLVLVYLVRRIRSPVK